MNKFGLIFLSFMLIIIYSGSGAACWCRREVLDTEAKVNGAIRKELRSSSVVFSGKVFERSASGLKSKVDKVWKGSVSDKIVFTSKNYLPQGSRDDGVEYFVWDCAYAFEIGQTYLVYARVESGQLEVSKCSRTQPLKEAARETSELDRLTAKKRSVKTP